jgi:hypothetical protein
LAASCCRLVAAYLLQPTAACTLAVKPGLWLVRYFFILFLFLFLFIIIFFQKGWSGPANNLMGGG